jgi:hypothetical protein
VSITLSSFSGYFGLLFELSLPMRLPRSNANSDPPPSWCDLLPGVEVVVDGEGAEEGPATGCSRGREARCSRMACRVLRCVGQRGSWGAGADRGVTRWDRSKESLVDRLAGGGVTHATRRAYLEECQRWKRPTDPSASIPDSLQCRVRRHGGYTEWIQGGCQTSVGGIVGGNR